jgi:DNA-binding response OmpR family regulator
MRILLVEDNKRLAETIAKGLRERSFAVDVAFDGENALFEVEINDYDVIVLDVMIPAPDGFEVCRRLRGRKIQTPILMLTARDTTADKIRGLDTGADDYLTKPFEFGELLARIRALLRRRTGEIVPAKFEIADLIVETKSRKVWRGGREISLTTKEYALLEFMVREKGKVLGRSEIAEHCWDENFEAFSNTIDVYIKRLRAKIDEGAAVKLIHTRRGAGYILDDV